MVLVDQFLRLQNGILDPVSRDWYQNFGKYTNKSNMAGAHVSVLRNPEAIPLCLYFEDMWRLFEEVLQFRSSYKYMEHNEGCLAVGNGHADILLSPVSLRNSWGIIHPPVTSWYDVHVRQPPLIGSSGFYVSVLPLQISLLQLILLLGFPFVMWILLKITRKLIGCFNASFLDCLLTTIGIFCSQGLQYTPKSLSFRIFLLSMMYHSYIMVAAYSALLIVKLSVTVAPLPFQSLEELKEMQTYQVCYNKGTFVENYFMQKVIPHFDRLEFVYPPEWKHRVNGNGCPLYPNGYLIDEELVPALCSEEIATMTLSLPPLDYSTLDPSCTIVKLKPKYLKDITTPAINKDFPFIKLLNDKSIRFREAGLSIYMFTKHLTTKNYKNNDWKQKHIITLSHVSGIFKVFLVAVIFAVLILFIEILSMC